MRKTIQLEPKGYYLIESLACGRNCYFECEEEVESFKKLFSRYISKYAEIHKMYISSEGYQILLRIKSKEVLLKRYSERIRKADRVLRKEFEQEPWRIISEQIRIFLSVYVKMVNRKRGRKGTLVQDRYRRYHFETLEEFDWYIEKMECEKKEIESQEKVRYRVSLRWKEGVNWVKKRGVDWVESLMAISFRNYVVQNMINFTLKAHLHHPHPT